MYVCALVIPVATRCPQAANLDLPGSDTVILGLPKIQVRKYAVNMPHRKLRSVTYPVALLPTNIWMTQRPHQCCCLAVLRTNPGSYRTNIRVLYLILQCILPTRVTDYAAQS